MKIIKLEGVRVLKPVAQGDKLRVMSLSDIRLGHPEGVDSDFLNRTLKHIKELPPNEKPHVAVVPGLTYGQRRKAIMTVDKQQMQAGTFIQGLEEMGITVVDRI